MKLKQLYLLVAFNCLFVTFFYAQRYNIQNGIGIYGGLTQLDIKTDNFITQSNKGFLGGMAATVDLPHKFYNISYNVQLSESKFDVAATPVIGPSEFVEYKLFAAQVALVMHVKIASKYLTADIGPMLQYNGNLQLVDESQESYIIDGYSALRADDILNINQFNINGTVGLTAGIDNFKIRAQYIYGFTNTLNKLNSQDLNVENDNNFKGNMNMLAFTAMIQF